MTFDLEKPWTAYPFTAIDFETTGVDALTCGPVSVAAVRFEQGVEVGHYHSLLSPGCPIPESASAIHGITEAHVAEAPTLEEVSPHLLDLCKGAVPVAYNAIYDRTIMHRHIVDPAVPAFNPAQLWLCALVVIKDVDRYVKGTGRHRLEVTCERWQVALDGAHNALADARATGRLVVQLVRAGKLVHRFPLGKLLAHIEARRIVQQKDFEAYQAKRAAAEAAKPKAEQTALPLDGGAS